MQRVRPRSQPVQSVNPAPQWPTNQEAPRNYEGSPRLLFFIGFLPGFPRILIRFCFGFDFDLDLAGFRFDFDLDLI